MLNIIALAALTRLLSPDAYGVYAFVMAGVGLAVGISLGWLREGLLRFLPTDASGGAGVVGTVRGAFLGIAGLTGAAVLVVAAADLLREYRTFLLLGLVVFWVQGWYEIQRDMARISLVPGIYGTLSLARAFLFLVTAVVLAYLGWGATGVLVAAVLASAGAVALAGRSLGRRPGGFRPDRSNIKELATFGSPLAAGYVLWYLVVTSDRLLLGWFTGAESVGLYSANYDITDKTIGVVMLVLHLAFYPVIVRRFTEEGWRRSRVRLTAYFGVLVAAVVPAAAGMAAVAPELAEVLVGLHYRETGALIIPWIAAGALLSGVKLYYVDIAFLLARRTSLHMYAAGGTAVASVGLNLWLIPLYGVMGAAVTTVVSAVVALGLSWPLARSALPLPLPLALLVRPVLAAGGMLGVLSAIPPLEGVLGLAIKVVAGALVYGALLLLLDGVGAGPRLRRLVRQLAYPEPAPPR